MIPTLVCMEKKYSCKNCSCHQAGNSHIILCRLLLNGLVCMYISYLLMLFVISSTRFIFPFLAMRQQLLLLLPTLIISLASLWLWLAPCMLWNHLAGFWQNDTQRLKNKMRKGPPGLPPPSPRQPFIWEEKK